MSCTTARSAWSHLRFRYIRSFRQLHLRLETEVRAHGGLVLYAPLDIVLTDFDVVQPDLIVFSAERAHLIHPKVVPRHPPDLAIEILSPTTAATDRGRKKALLAKHLVREYWLVDPVAQRLEVHRLGADGFALAIAAERHDVVTPIVLPQLSFRPSDVIPDVP